MRVKPDKLQVMKIAMKAIADEFSEAIKDYSGKFTYRRFIWDVWNLANQNLRYDDSHPFFENGRWKRLTPHVPGFDMYSDGDNDTHIETAIKVIGQELSILPKGCDLSAKITQNHQ